MSHITRGTSPYLNTIFCISSMEQRAATAADSAVSGELSDCRRFLRGLLYSAFDDKARNFIFRITEATATTGTSVTIAIVAGNVVGVIISKVASAAMAACSKRHGSTRGSVMKPCHA